LPFLILVADGNGKHVPPATFGFLAQMRTAPLGAVAVDMNVAGYAFLRLAMPTSPSRPKPKSRMAGAVYTVERRRIKRRRVVFLWVTKSFHSSFQNLTRRSN